jgi:hypothetical protein
VVALISTTLMALWWPRWTRGQGGEGAALATRAERKKRKKKGMAATGVAPFIVAWRGGRGGW